MATQFDGREWAALKPMCETLGVDHATQLRKLQRRSWAVVGQKPMTAADGKSYQTTVIDSQTIPLWLATIDENRVAPEAKSKLIAYQREARAALDAYFNGRTVAVAPVMNQLDVLRAALDQIEAAQREASEAKDIATKTEARLDAIEARHDWFSALGYARHVGIADTSNPAMNRLGRRAAAIARASGITPEHVQHQHYGLVNLLPVWVWEAAIEQLELQVAH
jgi:hypothetical protein